jgi:serine/threonine protein kinase
LSQIADQEASAENLIGTPTLIAPEQFIHGAKHNPFKADVYSFGMLLFELATYKVFFSLLLSFLLPFFPFLFFPILSHPFLFLFLPFFLLFFSSL